MKQHEAVIHVMKERGGYATLSQLYEEALDVPGVEWGTKTPFASIRRIVQKRPEIFKIRPGLWALEAFRDQLPYELTAADDETDEIVQEYNHAYYQGLLVEIGNWRDFLTFVPAQDKNRLFLGKTLGDHTTVQKIFGFGHKSVVEKAQWIDVIWFNAREMPHAAYEVEHSTDMKNSLLKFLELQDFNVDFKIVADEKRTNLFTDRINFEAFRPIRERVKFLSYQDLAEWHTKSKELYLVERRIG